MVSAENLKEVALEAGFDLVGFAAPPSRDDQEAYYAEVRERTDRGFRPGLVFPWMENWRLPSETRTVVALGLNYFQEQGEVEPERGCALIARYHTGACTGLISRSQRFRWSLETLGIKPLNPLGPSPLPLKWFAERAGLGWRGKHSLIVTPEYGSWVVWDAVLLAEEFPPDDPITERGCGDCVDCLKACPTSAVFEPYKVNPTRCFTLFSDTLAPLDGAWPIKQARQAFGARVLACDICQEACPHNRRVQKPGRPDTARLPLCVRVDELLTDSEETYQSRHRLTFWGIPRDRVQAMVELMLGGSRAL